ncbi:putative potassium channel regulatory protein unc-93 [Aphelenchoides besseyi]|nr:putative potassium channel regulatory protein unc-93 [Aphelenchoides besseyi]KAI6194347.1 putative potassium channel regulatory protein unc-93 [Aphelenchoides besseyi]
MDGNNAWDLVEDEDRESGTSRSTSTSDSETGPVDTSEEANLPTAARLRRSKSPAVESIRKVSRIVFQKIGLQKRPKPPQCVPLNRTFDLPQFPLSLFCEKPSEFSYARDHKKIISKETLKRRRDRTIESVKEKCSYLFRSQDSGLEQHYADAVFATVQPERSYVYDPFCPVHGSKRVLARKRRLLDMSSFVNSIDTADNDQLAPILNSDAVLAKAIRKRQRALGAQGGHVLKAKRKIQTNLLIISFAFLFLFTGFHGLQYLQTAINGQMGADALGTFYLSLAISSLIVPSFVVNRLGSKLTLITAFGVHLVYMLANFLPRYYSLIPASTLAGISASCMWSANSYYITQSGINYAKLNVEAQNTVIVRFFGLFFMIVHVGQVCGTLLSSLILNRSMDVIDVADEMDRTCGSGFPSNLSYLSSQAQQNLKRPSQLAFSSVVAVDLCCVLVAVMVVAFFLNALKRDEIRNKKPPKFSAEVLILTLRNLQKPKVLLLIPLTIFNGVEQAFIVGVYPRNFVACALGISQIGFVLTTFGISDAICSLVFGPLIRMFGRMPLFVFGSVMNILTILTLIIYPINPTDRVFFNVIAGVWGMADSVWNTQIQGFWVGITGRSSLEVSFASYRFWTAFGLALGFFSTRFLSVNQYLAISFVLLLIGILGYFLIELYDPIMALFKTTQRSGRQAHFEPELGEKVKEKKKDRLRNQKEGTSSPEKY